jgi:hypothetical protein
MLAVPALFGPLCFGKEFCAVAGDLPWNFESELVTNGHVKLGLERGCIVD